MEFWRSDHNEPRAHSTSWVAGLVALGCVLLGSAFVEATVIEYEVASVGGTTWEYSYTIENDSLGVAIDDFVVLFDENLFSNLHLAVAPPDWDPLALQPDVALPAPGLYDALALVSGLAPGASLGGFSVRADYLGAGAPGQQPFEIYDIDFNLLDTGMTVVRTASVPAPGTMVLFTLGILGAGNARRRRRL